MAPRFSGSIHTTGTPGNDFRGFRGQPLPQIFDVQGLQPNYRNLHVSSYTNN